MGRSSHEQAQKNRQKIVECAARLFREFGVDNVSVAEVMSAADMTIGGFYKHFESKDALVEEVFSLTLSSPRPPGARSLTASTTMRVSIRPPSSTTISRRKR